MQSISLYIFLLRPLHNFSDSSRAYVRRLLAAPPCCCVGLHHLNETYSLHGHTLTLQMQEYQRNLLPGLRKLDPIFHCVSLQGNFLDPSVCAHQLL